MQFQNKIASLAHWSLWDDRRRWPRQCWEAQQLQFIDKSCERSVGDIQKIPKTVEIPQVQFMPSCHTETE